MTAGDPFVATSVSLASGASFTVDGSSGATGVIEVNTIAVTGAADIKDERDTSGNGVFNVSIVVDSLGGATHSQKNKLQIDSTLNQRLRIENTSDSAITVQVTGVEAQGGTA
jgi:hypothetical protein